MQNVCNIKKLLGFVDDVVFGCQKSDITTFGIICSRLAIVGLFVIGLVHWSWFISFGDVAAKSDWEEQIHYLAVIHKSITTGVIPYIVPNGFYFTDLFMGNLQVPFSPQIIVVLLLRLDHFLVFNTMFMYSIGFIGCLVLKTRFQLSLLSFTFVYLLFNFNGHITSHISIGHPWLGYFLLPFFVLCVLDLIRSESGHFWVKCILCALVLFTIVLQGSFHVFLWCSLFLLLVGVFNPRLFKSITLIIVFSGLLSAFRFIPALFFYSDSTPSYASGFPTISVFIDALTTVKAHSFAHPSTSFYDVGWYEHDHYIGLLGVILIGIFGGYYRFKNTGHLNSYKFPALDWPLMLMILFSFGVFFDFLSDLRIAWFSWAERVPSRLFIVPLVFLVVLSAIRMEAIMPHIKANLHLKMLVLSGIMLLSHSLATHSWYWKVIESGDRCCYGVGPFKAPGIGENLYTSSVNAGLFISVITLVILMLVLCRNIRRQD